MLAIEARGSDIRTAESLGGARARRGARPRSPTTTPSSAGSARPASSSRCGPPSTRTRTRRPSKSKPRSPATSAAAAPTSRCGTPSFNSARRGAKSWPRQKAGPKHGGSSARKIKRLDGPDKATGRAKYSYDINRKGMLHGMILRSPYAHAKIKSIDTTAARKMPGLQGHRHHRHCPRTGRS